MSKAAQIIVIIAVIIAIIIGYGVYSTSQVTQVVEKQLNDIRENNPNKAYSYTSLDFQKATTLEDFKEFIEKNSDLKNNKAINFSSRSINHDVGYLRGSLTAKDGAVMPVEFKMVKENGEWRVLAIQLNPPSPD